MGKATRSVHETGSFCELLDLGGRRHGAVGRRGISIVSVRDLIRGTLSSDGTCSVPHPFLNR
jgi:hypothetical protein